MRNAESGEMRNSKREARSGRKCEMRSAECGISLPAEGGGTSFTSDGRRKRVALIRSR